MLDTAKEYIEGKITIDEAQKRIYSYYEQRTTCTGLEDSTKEANIVSARITKLLAKKHFNFLLPSGLPFTADCSRASLTTLEKSVRINISPKMDTERRNGYLRRFQQHKGHLGLCFCHRKQFSYEGLLVETSVKHLAKFASDILQIRPFGEGNSRATAVFMIKYMKTFGFRVNNDAFRENSWHFRNALVRANYNDLQKGIHSTTKFLELFFSNLLLGTNYELKNRYMYVNFVDETVSQSAKNETPKRQIDTLDCTLEEMPC